MAAAVEEGVGAVGGTTEKDASEESSLMYSLYAVLLHKGTLEKGHYFALIRDVEQNVWHRFDDDRVTRLDAEQLRRELRRAYGEMIRSCDQMRSCVASLVSLGPLSTSNS